MKDKLKNAMDIVCPGGCVMFKLKARTFKNENFHKDRF